MIWFDLIVNVVNHKTSINTKWRMKVVKDSYISINFYFVENIQSQMKQTPIKYFTGELMCFRRGSVSSLYSRDLQIVYSLTDGDLFHVNAFTCISHAIKLKIKIISGNGLFKMTGQRHQNLKGMHVASYTPTSPVPKMNLWIYWSESNSCIYS